MWPFTIVKRNVPHLKEALLEDNPWRRNSLFKGKHRWDKRRDKFEQALTVNRTTQEMNVEERLAFASIVVKWVIFPKIALGKEGLQYLQGSVLEWQIGESLRETLRQL